MKYTYSQIGRSIRFIDFDVSFHLKPFDFEISDIEQIVKDELEIKSKLFKAIKECIGYKNKIPTPKEINPEYQVLVIKHSEYAKILLINEIHEYMYRNKMKYVDIAEKFQIKPQEMTRVLDIEHKTKFSTLCKYMEKLGKQFEISVQ